MITLAELPADQTLIVEEIRGSESFRRRLYGLGFLPGARVRVVRQLPLGGPILVEVHGMQFGLRARDAGYVAGSPS